jgi:hypothetical protein
MHATKHHAPQQPALEQPVATGPSTSLLFLPVNMDNVIPPNPSSGSPAPRQPMVAGRSQSQLRLRRRDEVVQSLFQSNLRLAGTGSCIDADSCLAGQKIKKERRRFAILGLSYPATGPRSGRIAASRELLRPTQSRACEAVIIPRDQGTSDELFNFAGVASKKRFSHRRYDSAFQAGLA